MLQGTPASAAPSEATPPLSRDALEGVSDDPVPVPAGDVPEPSGVPDFPELPDYPEGKAALTVPEGRWTRWPRQPRLVNRWSSSH